MSVEVSIPKYYELFQPVLDALKDLGGSARSSEVIDSIIGQFSWSDEELARTTKGGEPLINNKIHWARLYLVKNGYLESSQRGVWSLTKIGNETTISPEDTKRIIQNVRRETYAAAKLKKDKLDPEVDDENHLLLDGDDHRAIVIRILKELPPGGFERLYQRLLRESDFHEVKVTGKSGDGGIDGIGIVQINPFVSFRVLFQCKRYEGSIGPSQIRDFRGAMQGRADKGIFLTTGNFTLESKREAIRDGVPPIELVDGEAMIDMLEELELGLTSKKAYEVDQDFFAEFDD